MATITVVLDENDIRAACMAWAVTRVLNTGTAVSCNVEVVVCGGKPSGAINKVMVDVETPEMLQSLPSYVAI
jgi:hypothetical protein